MRHSRLRPPRHRVERPRAGVDRRSLPVGDPPQWPRRFRDRLRLSVVAGGGQVPVPAKAEQRLYVENVPSSFVMVPTACPSRMLALTGELRLTKKVSFGSGMTSPLTVTVNVNDVVNAGMVTTTSVRAE